MHRPITRSARPNAAPLAVRHTPFANRVTIAAALALALVARTACAQAQIRTFTAVAATLDAVDPNDPKRQFQLPTQTPATREAFEEFERFRKRGIWERAFKELATIREKKLTGLLSDRDGFLLGADRQLRKILADLPPDGKAAYRLFYDGQAKSLFEQATGADELDRLTQISTSFFISSIGDSATDRLGDLHFESGDFDKAIDCWQAILEYLPESPLSPALLRVKVGTGLARADRRKEFDALLREVIDRHAGEKALVAGREIDPVEYLRGLRRTEEPLSDSTTAQTDTVADDLNLPTTTEPLWKFRYFSEPTRQQLAGLGKRYGWNTHPIASLVPPSVVDDERVYLNLLGHHLAIDLRTGKLLWRSASFHDLGQKMQNVWYLPTGQYSIAEGDKSVWMVTRDPSQLRNNAMSFRLDRLDPITGKVVWSSKTVSGLKNWNFTGAPLVVGDTVYAAASHQQKAVELNVVAIDVEGGEQRWATHIGNYHGAPNRNNMMQSPQPSLLFHNEQLYVDTNGGALVRLNADTGTLDWGFAYESVAPPMNANFRGMPARGQGGSSRPPIVRGRLLFLKGAQSNRLYALRFATPAIEWQRPVDDRTASLAGVDDDAIVIAGSELSVIDAGTRKTRSVNKVPSGGVSVTPLVTANRVYQFTPRGIYELDKTTLDQLGIFRGDDLESVGGQIHVVGDLLITVSNLAVTAYSLTTDPDAESTETAARRQESAPANEPVKGGEAP